MKLEREERAIPSLVREYELLEQYLRGLGYDTDVLTMEQSIKIKLAIQDLLEAIEL